MFVVLFLHIDTAVVRDAKLYFAWTVWFSIMICCSTILHVFQVDIQYTMRVGTPPHTLVCPSIITSRREGGGVHTRVYFSMISIRFHMYFALCLHIDTAMVKDAKLYLAWTIWVSISMISAYFYFAWKVWFSIMIRSSTILHVFQVHIQYTMRVDTWYILVCI